MAALLGAVARADEPAELLQTDSDAPYIHNITLYDHEGAAIDPTDEFAGPYSPRATCAKCHPYGEIACGWHFNAPTEYPGGRPGEPWLLIDDQRGTQRAVSGRGWPGTRTLAEAGLTRFQFVKRFGRHLPGGGYGEPRDEEVAGEPERFRWDVSGRLEIDCMVCHSADQRHDPAELARQIEAENFRWAPTAALGLAVIRGEARKAPDDWDPLMPPHPDFPEQAGPRLVWDRARFDPDQRVLFNITRRIPNERCSFCHTVRVVGRGEDRDLVAQRDVHLTAGLLCVDCHRNELDHLITRGYRTEPLERVAPHLAAFTCEGCHLGVAGADDPAVHLGGRYGAPHPQHRGLPPLHFRKLACTACHSGAWPADETYRVQTSLAHGLGIASRDRTPETPPYIVEPVFARQDDERIAPQRMFVGVDEEGRALTYRWSLAHGVRPASQSLGVGGCADCHARGAAFYFGQTLPAADPPPAPLAAETMVALRGDDVVLAGMWNLGFGFRPAFKVYALLCAAIILLVLLRFAGDVFYQQVFRVNPAGQAVATAAPLAGEMTWAERAAHALLVLAVLSQAMTGVGSNLRGVALEGGFLLVHMAGAGLFVTMMTVVTLQWAHRCLSEPGAPPTGGALTTAQRWVFWLVLAVGLVVMLTMLLALLPLFGYAGQHNLVEIHETAALALLVLMVVHTIVSLRARAGRRRS